MTTCTYISKRRPYPKFEKLERQRIQIMNSFQPHYLLHIRREYSKSLLPVTNFIQANKRGHEEIAANFFLPANS